MLNGVLNPNFIKTNQPSSSYFKVQERILADTQLNSTQKLVYIALVSLNEADYLSYEEIAHRASSSQQETIEAIGVLVEKGYLKIKKPPDSQLKKQPPELYIVDLEYLRTLMEYAQQEDCPELIERIGDFSQAIPTIQELLELLKPSTDQKSNRAKNPISWEDINKIYFKTFSTMMNSIIKDDIESYIKEGQMNKELIIYALRESALANAKNFKYTKKMLDDWQEQGIRNIRQAKKAKEDYEQQSKESHLSPSSYDDPEIDKILRKIIK